MLALPSQIQKWIAGALILIGALSACTSVTPQPITIPTLTLLPNTETPIPILPSDTPAITSTPVPITTTPTPIPFTTILEITITPDVDLTRRILRDLADSLGTDISRIQIVTIEAESWFDDNLGCDQQTSLDVIEAVATFQTSNRVDGLRYVLLVGNTAHEYHTKGVQRFISCTSTEQITGEILLAVDPIAADMLFLVQRRVANELDISTRRVQLMSIVPHVWSDTSLGCPQENQTYTQANIAGYRIVVSAGDNDYAYHSDSTTAIECPAGQENLGD